MTQEDSYLRVIISAQVEADNAHMQIRGESLRNKTNETLHALALIAWRNSFLSASISISSS